MGWGLDGNGSHEPTTVKEAITSHTKTKISKCYRFGFVRNISEELIKRRYVYAEKIPHARADPRASNYAKLHELEKNKSIPLCI